MLKVGITGQNGFIGNHLYNTIALKVDEYKLIDFRKEYFEQEEQLDIFVSKCDVIVHLAALNRHQDQKMIYSINVRLVECLIASLDRTNSSAHVILSSSTQEDLDNIYGKSKKEGRELLLKWANNSDGSFSGLIIPNVFGPFGKPNYNSVVATFCHKLVNGEKTKIIDDKSISLIYVGELVREILNVIEKNTSDNKLIINATNNIKVSEILNTLNSYKNIYQINGEIPSLNSTFELNLFNTFRSHLDHENHFPVQLSKNSDSRGMFVEIIRIGVGGQLSFSTTLPGITRGNHFHKRKIERFAVIKGKALIQLRRIGTDKILEFCLDGDQPAYVDMPIWYTHNIKNIGDDILYTNFWINEAYDPNDSDTYFEKI